MINKKVSKQGQNTKRPDSLSATLVLNKNQIFKGLALGAKKTVVGEVCFNTSMTGYQEIITDPSYDRQIITFTNPHIGNTGINLDDYESSTHGCSGIIIRNYPTTGSSWRNKHEFIEFLKDKSISAVCSVDTRYLTSLLRNKGSLNGCIVPDIKNLDKAKTLLSEFSGLNGLDLAKNVTTNKEYILNEGTHDLIDIKYTKDKNILKDQWELPSTDWNKEETQEINLNSPIKNTKWKKK